MNERVVKTLAIVAFLAVGAAALIARNSPAMGYEISIYSSTPIAVWLGIGVALVCGIAIAVRCAFGDHSIARWWALGFVCILLANVLVVALLIVRGYAFFSARGDAGTHIGLVRALIENGHFFGTNKYPVLHVLVTEMYHLTGLAVEYLGMVLPLIFTVIGEVFVYLWARTLFTSRRAIVFMTVAGTMLTWGCYTHLAPNSMGAMLFPVFLYVSTKTMTEDGNRGFLPVLLLFVFLLPVLHPVPSFALAFIITALWCANALMSKFQVTGGHLRTRFRTNLSIAVLLCVITIAWISNFRDWALLWESLLLESDAVATQLATARNAVALGFDVVAYFFKSDYFALLSFCLAALAAFPIVLRAAKHDDCAAGKLMALYGPFLGLCLLFVSTWFVDLKGAERIVEYILLLACPFVGLLLTSLMPSKTRGRLFFAILVVSVLASMSFLGVMRVYPSPYMQGFNPQTTYAEIHGMDWYFRKSGARDLSGLTVAPGRMTDFLYSVSYRWDVRYYPDYLELESWIPYHFGYDKYSMLGCSYLTDVYVVLTDLDRRLYVDVLPEIADIRMLPRDFVMLEHDPSVDKVYINGGLDVWCVESIACASVA